MNVHRAEVTSLAARYRLPAVYPYRFFAELGVKCGPKRGVSSCSAAGVGPLFASKTGAVPVAAKRDRFTLRSCSLIYSTTTGPVG
jgi:hypothetical protein